MHVEAYLQGLNVDVDTGAVWLSAVNSAAEYDLHDNNPTIPCGSRVGLCNQKHSFDWMVWVFCFFNNLFICPGTMSGLPLVHIIVQPKHFSWI